MNPVGRPVVDVQVTLVQDNKVVYQARTDKSGEFRFDHVKGYVHVSGGADTVFPRDAGNRGDW